jgi:hypothetical protein
MGDMTDAEDVWLLAKRVLVGRRGTWRWDMRRARRGDAGAFRRRRRRWWIAEEVRLGLGLGLGWLMSRDYSHQMIQSRVLYIIPKSYIPVFNFWFINGVFTNVYINLPPKNRTRGGLGQFSASAYQAVTPAVFEPLGVPLRRAATV